MRIRSKGLRHVALLSWGASVLPFLGVDPLAAALTLAEAVYAVFLFDKIQPKLVARRIGIRDVAISLPLLAPLALLNNYFAVVPSAAFLAAALIAAYSGRPGWGNALGTGFVASLSIIWGYANGAYTPLPQALWTAYAFAEALYVEYKAPFREFHKRAPLAAWIAGVAAAAPFIAAPFFLAPLVEPTARYAAPGPKLSSPREMASLGRSLMKRTLLFFTLLTIATLLAKFLYFI